MLQVVPAGTTDVTSQTIGTLRVSSGSIVSVTLDALTKEIKTQQDDSKRCLALAVPKEAGLRMGNSSPLTPRTFAEIDTGLRGFRRPAL